MTSEPVQFPSVLTIEPLTRPPDLVVRVPGSKSITNRALVLAALGNGAPSTQLHGALKSEDTEIMVAALQALGFSLECDWRQRTILVRAALGERPIPSAQADLHVGNSGTTMRFLTAVLALGNGRYRIDGVERMRQRPIGDLLEALAQFGARVRSERDNGCPPVIIESTGDVGGPVRIRGNISSQFLSGLLLAAPRAARDTAIEVQGTLVSEPYVEMTVRMLRDFGCRIERPVASCYFVPGKQSFGRDRYHIEPDASAASYFFAAAAITGGRIRIEGLTRASLQGDVRFVDLLKQMGCEVMEDAMGITVRGGRLRGIDCDMNDISDCVMTLAAVACFADGPTTIRNVGHIRHKETDRIAALAAELRKLGATAIERQDGLEIQPTALRSASVATYNDHRMAMSLALVGLRVPGVVIQNPSCVAKTYPGFFEDFQRLRV